jgi:transmembrane sensor
MPPADTESGASLPSRPARSAAAIERVAADWLALQACRPLTGGERAAFEAWCGEDARHAAAVAELAATWRTLDGLAAYPRPTDDPANPDFFTRPVPFRRRWGLALGVAAAVAAGLLGVLSPSWREARPEVREAGWTADGARQRLADGSIVELRADARVELGYTAGARRVRLLQGEAFFTVARDASRPFIVEAGGAAVRAVGTAFAVRVAPTAVVVLVAEGVVMVKPPIPPITAADPATGNEGSFETQLVAGQRTTVVTAEAEALLPLRVETLSAAEIARELAWQGGALAFEATPLSEVVVQFSQRNARRIEIAQPELAGLQISGRFRADNLEGFVELLESSFGVTVERRAEVWVLRR